MKNPFLHIITSVLIIMFLTAFTNNAKPAKFNVSISQNGKKVEIKNNVVILNPASFDIDVEMSEPMGVLVNASYTMETLDLASANEPIHKLPGFVETGMAEGLLNTTRELYVTETAPSYWFYDNNKEHRFNTIIKTKSGLICKRTIENLYDIDAETNTEVSDMKKAVYLVFILTKEGETLADRKELQRQYLTIKWKK